MNIETQHAMRCDNLLEAIDFFSQILHPEQLAEYGYAYIHEALCFDSSYIFMRNQKQTQLTLIGSRGADKDLEPIMLTEQVKCLATKVGVVLVSDLDVYMPESIMTAYKPNFLMPLIVADELIGLIVSSDWRGETHEALMFAEALKKLVNNAFYTGIQMERNKDYRVQMDRKLYDQMLLHQLVEVAISEREIDQVIKNCVDGLRELTASAQTSFCLVETYSGKIVTKHFTDLITFKNVYGEVAWRSHIEPKRMTYSMAEHRDELEALFGSLELFERLEAEYVILLKMNPVIGFVTLGAPLGTQEYTKSTFDLIESIMNTICIAIENANHIAVLNNQKTLLNSTVEAMTQLGDSIKTVNSATDMSELSNLLFQSINLYAGIDEAALAIRNDDGTYRVVQSTQEALQGRSFELTEQGRAMLERGLVLDLTAGSLPQYLAGIEGAFDQNQTIISPIDVVRLTENANGPEGLLIGLNMNRKFLNYELKYVETLASSVAPIMRQLIEKEALEMASEKTEAARFLEALESYEQHKQELWMDYKVFYKKNEASIFAEKQNLLPDRPTYLLGQLYCCFAYEEEPIDETCFDGVLDGSPDEIVEALEQLCV